LASSFDDRFVGDVYIGIDLFCRLWIVEI
jgi:hypothetical protein